MNSFTVGKGKQEDTMKTRLVLEIGNDEDVWMEKFEEIPNIQIGMILNLSDCHPDKSGIFDAVVVKSIEWEKYHKRYECVVYMPQPHNQIVMIARMEDRGWKLV